MRLSNVFVIAQVITMLSLAVLFWADGNHRLAIAQAAYCIATGVLFFG